MDIEVSKFEDLHAAVRDGRNVIYRGVQSVEHLLVPKIGRYPKFQKAGDTLKEEKYLLRLFKQQAVRFVQHGAMTDWEWLPLRWRGRTRARGQSRVFRKHAPATCQS